MTFRGFTIVMAITFVVAGAIAVYVNNDGGASGWVAGVLSWLLCYTINPSGDK